MSVSYHTSGSDQHSGSMNKSNESLIRPSSCTPDSGTGSGNSLASSGSSSSSINGDRFSPFQCNVAAQILGGGCVEMADLLPSSFDADESSKIRKLSESSSIYEDNPMCELHRIPKDYFCYTCVWEVCVECIKRGEHNEHYLYPGLSCKELFLEADKVRKSVKDNCNLIERQLSCLHYRKCATINHIQNFFQKLHEMIAYRERQLLATVNYVSDSRTRSLDQKLKEHQTAVAASLQTTDMLFNAIKSGNSEYVLQTSRSAKKNLEFLRRTQRNFQYFEEDLAFIPPDEAVMQAVRDIGTVNVPPAAQTSSTNGMYSNNNNNHTNSSSSVVMDMVNSFQSFSPFSNSQTVPSFYGKPAITNGGGFMPDGAPGMIDPSILAQPDIFPVSFHTNRNYSRIKRPVTIFGSEGTEDGKLCRPWGVCCDANGQVIIADRSNNRIQIFRLDGTFVRKFGTAGSGEGELNRPASVAIDYYGRIVVTDKDNHRIQIFTMDGNFVFMFGERGQSNGKFHYPWDVAVNSNGVIAISDTRNHRIQLFSGNGVFLKKFGFESLSNMWKFFDSPRGVCFTSSNTLIVTDFNNHRLYEIDVDKNPKLVNCDNYKKCELFRPQGLAIDEDGNILVADCRNNRIQVFDRFGQNIGQFGVSGKEAGQFDRPSGIALTPDGKIVVIDFGNHRVQIF